MNGSIVRHLILKDLYLLRWISIIATAGGLVAAWLISLSPFPIGGGGVLLICALIVLNILLVFNGVVQERKDQVAVFVLSLPVSPAQYVTAKVVANGVAFTVPWVILTAATAVAINASQVPNGFLPLWMAVLGYLFFYYCVLLGVGLSTSANGWHAVAITVGNISVNFLIMLLFSLPSVRAYGEGDTAVWTFGMAGLIAAEFVGGLAVLALATYANSRRTELV